MHNFILFEKISKWYFSKRAVPYWCVLFMDCAIVAASTIVAYYILNGGDAVASHFWMLCLDAAGTALAYAIFFKVYHTYSGIVRYSSFVDLWRIGAACASGALLCCAFVGAYRIADVPKTIAVFQSFVGEILIAGFSISLMAAARVIVKILYDIVRVNEATRTAFIYGVKTGAIGVARAVRDADPVRFAVKGFIQPEGETEKADWIMGLKVYKDDDNLIETLLSEHINTIIVSPLQIEHFSRREKLVNALVSHNILIEVINGAEEWDGKSDLKQDQLRPVKIEELLPRDVITVDMVKIGELLTGKTVMITGAAGSIGSEMVRQIAAYNPKRMVLIDQAETPMHDIRLLMARKYSFIPNETIVTSITNQARMEAIFAANKPDYVFHAAAYKHVPMMEDNPAEAVQNNVRGTRIIADLAVKYGTKKFVMISTDKAVNPTNVMGCSKRICEIYCQSLNQAIVDGKVEGVTQFVTTRFGNVLGSNGSVIPIFREQIEKGGPITVTHPDIIRYFMLIPEACKLVLEAGTLGHGGEIFVFDMGKPVKIVDLAKNMIKLSGAKNIDIQFTGLRDGEKLYEEVLSDKENTIPTEHPKIMVAKVRNYDYADACKNEERLLEASWSFDDMAVVKVMKEIVPEFKSKVSKYEVLD